MYAANMLRPMERVSFEESCAALRMLASTRSRPLVYMSVSQSSTTYSHKDMSAMNIDSNMTAVDQIVLLPSCSVDMFNIFIK